MKRAILRSLLCICLELPVCIRAQSAPYANTQAAVPITTNNATLNGMVVPNGYDTLAWFEWGANGSYGHMTAPVSVGNGFTVMRVSASVNNLPAFSAFQCRLASSSRWSTRLKSCRARRIARAIGQDAEGAK